MKRRYKEAFEQLNTRENLEESIISTCMSAQPENTPELRRIPKRVVPVAIAAALGVGVLGVSAYAITTNIHKQADTYFMQNGANTEVITGAEADSEERVYDEYYRELGLSATSEDTTINLHGYVSDDQTVYLFGNIIAPEDMVLDNDVPDTDMDYDFGIPDFEIDTSKLEGPGGMMPNLTFLPFDPGLPNQREFVYKVTYFNGFDWDAITGLTITEFNLVTEKKYIETTTESLITGEWKFPELNLTTTQEPIPLINEPTTVSWYHIPQDKTFEITYSEITVSLSGVHLTELENKEARSITNYCSIIMKDGTVYEQMNENPDNILVDVDEIDYVQIGDNIFHMPTENETAEESVPEEDDSSRIYDEYYRELGLSAVSGDTTVNLHGFISDNCHVYLFGNIIAPSDMVLDAENPDTDQEYDFGGGIPEMEWGGNHGAWNGHLSFLPYDETVPNQREFVYSMLYTGDFEWDMIKSLTFTDFRIVNDKHDHETIISGTWEFPVLDLTTTYEPISLIDETVELSWTFEDTGVHEECVVDNIKLSIFGVQFETAEGEQPCQPANVDIVMQDGTVYERMHENVDNIIVDISQIDYIQIGDQRFDVTE